MSNTHSLNGGGGGGGAGVNTINGVSPVSNNINLIDENNVGAITITAPGSAGAGSVGIGVNVDGDTIQIVGTAPNDVLTVANTLVVIGNTTTVAPFEAIIYDVPLTNGNTYYFEADYIGSDVGQTRIAGGKQQAIVSYSGGIATIIDIQNQYNSTLPNSPPSGELDAQFQVDGGTGNLQFAVFGSAAQNMSWKARINFVTVP